MLNYNWYFHFWAENFPLGKVSSVWFETEKIANREKISCLGKIYLLCKLFCIMETIHCHFWLVYLTEIGNLLISFHLFTVSHEKLHDKTYMHKSAMKISNIHSQHSLPFLSIKKLCTKNLYKFDNPFRILDYPIYDSRNGFWTLH